MKSILQILLILALLSALVLFNYGAIDLRFEEIRYLLGTIAAKEDVSNTFGIIAKYELIKRRMLYGEESISNYELEARIQALTSGDQIKEEKNRWTFKAYRVPVRLTVNAVRILLGKKIINPREDDNVLSVLEVAYFWERSRNYNEAIKLYDDILKITGIAPAISAAIGVHKGFCLSMLGNYGESKEIYEKVINLYSTTEAGMVAWKLLDFIKTMEKNRADLENQNYSEMDRAKQSYHLMDFRSAIKNYSIFLGKKPPVEMMSEARFYKGRSHEELGESEEAMMEYKEVMTIDKSKVWAKQANRRLLMIGSFYEQQADVADKAKKQLEVYQDEMFMSNVKQYADMVIESSLKNELMKGVQSKEKVKINDSLLNSVLNLGELDLSGEKAALKEQKMDSIRSALIETGKVSAAEMKELKRLQAVSQHEYRRPNALKSIIDDYSSELKYIYNKKLRSGVKLSGKMLVEIKIRSDGTVAKTMIAQSDLGDQEFEGEILQRIYTWKFQAVPDAIGEMSIKYPFEFDEE